MLVSVIQAEINRNQLSGMLGGILTNMAVHLCVRGALSCWFGDRGQSEYHSEKAKKVYAQGI